MEPSHELFIPITAQDDECCSVKSTPTVSSSTSRSSTRLREAKLKQKLAQQRMNQLKEQQKLERANMNYRRETCLTTDRRLDEEC